ncbi:MAG: hypothetical protein RIQ94_1724 [Pseudomonadota bacterium]
MTTTIRVTSDVAWVRPGFHPYFSLTQNSFIDIRTTRVDIASLPHDSMQKYMAASISEVVKLIYHFEPNPNDEFKIELP